MNKNKIPSRIAVKFANLVFIVAIFFSFSYVIYSIYKVYNFDVNIKPTFYFIIIIFGTLSGSLFIFGLRLDENIKINLSVLVITLSISFYGFEIYLDQKIAKKYENSLSLKKMKIKKAVQLGIPYDKRTKLEVLQDFNKEDVKIYPNIPPSLLLRKSSTQDGLNTEDSKIFPLGGIANKVSIGANENGYWMKYKSDKFGFNNPNDVYQNMKIDIVMIGDSYTEGYAVKNNETIAAVLKEFNFSVVNIGKAGNGPLLEFATLNEYAKPLKPKILLWLFFAHDIWDLHNELRSSILKKYLNNDQFSQNLRSKQNEIDRLWINYVNKKWSKERNREIVAYNWVSKILKLSLLSNFRSLFKLNPEAIPQHDKLDYVIFKNILEKSRDMVSAWNGKLYFIYLPHYCIYTTNFIFDDKEKNCRQTEVEKEQVFRIITNLDIPIIDTTKEIFDTHLDALSLFPFRLLGHYNAKGYRLIAETINNRLKMDKIALSNLNN